MNHASMPVEREVSSEINGPADLFVFALVVVPVGIGIALALFRGLRAVALEWLTAHKILVPSPLVEIPETGVGFDLPRILIVVGALVVIAVVLVRFLPRPGERPPR